MGNYPRNAFTKRVHAGKRTYFFDVRETRAGGDFYLQITERKATGEEVERHRLFLYKEDFDKFIDALDEAIDFAKAKLASG